MVDGKSRNLDEFEAGRKDFLEHKPRPSISTSPPEYPEAARWFGWMMARADSVSFIFRWVRLLNLDPKEEGKRVNAVVRALDMEHGLNPDVRDEYGHSTHLKKAKDAR